MVDLFYLLVYAGADFRSACPAHNPKKRGDNMTTVLPQSSNLPLHEQLRAHARATPDKPAYLWYGEAITYAQIDQASDAFAAHLLSLGVSKGEPVVLFMNNCPQYVM